MKESKEPEKILKMMRKAHIILSLRNSNFWHFSSNPPSKLECLNFNFTILNNKSLQLFEKINLLGNILQLRNSKNVAPKLAIFRIFGGMPNFASHCTNCGLTEVLARHSRKKMWTFVLAEILGHILFP